MLRAVPDFVPSTAWVQVIGGGVSVHRRDGRERLAGSGQRLLAVLVAAGVDGATAERIAEEIWGDSLPNSWRPALRMAVARLRKQLPDDWDVVSHGGSYRITTAEGWIDAWRLERVVSDPEPITEPDLLWMLAGRPFAEVDLLEMVSASTQNLQMLQIAAAERFCAQQPASVTTATCGALVGLLRLHPYNDRLAMTIAGTLSSAGHHTEAVLAVSAFAETYQREFGPVSAEVREFLHAGAEEAGSPPTIETVDAEGPVVVKELRHLAESPLVGRSEEQARLAASNGALLLGPIGSGKSRLLADLMTSGHDTRTTYVVGDGQLGMSLGAFAVAIPELRDDLLASLNEPIAPGSASELSNRPAVTRAWRAVLGHFEQQSLGAPQRLIVDDAHLLDPVSVGLVRLLVRSNTGADVAFVIAGRSDVDEPEWIGLREDAVRAGLEHIEIGDLTIADTEALVLHHFPNATARVRRGLARDAFDASGGLVGVAAPLVARADPQTLELPEQLPGASALTRVASTLSESSPPVIAAAAVLGRQFSIGALLELCDLDESVILDVLDELWSAGLIVETDDPDQVKFGDVLVQAAFHDGVPLFRRSQLHRRAAQITTDPHKRADHLAQAGPLISADEIAAALLTSAQMYGDEENWRLAAREMRRIERISADLLDIASLTLWAQALDRSGRDGSRQRGEAFAMAIAAQDWEGALDAALSGLPHAELPDGDVERIDMLTQIPPDRLPEHRRFGRVVNLARQYALHGGSNDALLDCADKALELAVGLEQTGAAHLLRWTATRHSPAAEVHQVPDDAEFIEHPGMQTRIAHAATISAITQGDFELARERGRRLTELATAYGDPLGIWHAQTVEVMFLMGEAKFDEAEALGLQNYEAAQLHDIGQALASYFGQRLVLYRFQGRLGELAKELAWFRSSVASLLLGRAGVLAMSPFDGSKESVDELRAIVTEACSRPNSTLSLAAMMICARMMPEGCPDLIPQVEAILAPMGDRPVVAGFGSGHLGPTSRYLGLLQVDQDAAISLLEQAVQAADRHGPLAWRVVTRLDLARTGSSNALAEALELAAGTGLETIVARVAAGMGARE